MPAQPQTVFVVQWVHWEFDDYLYWPRDDGPVKAFRDRELAEVYRLEREEAEWRRCAENPAYRNPCRYRFPLSERTSLSEAELVARLTALGVPPPPRTAEGSETYVWDDGEWWDQVFEALPPERHGEVWKLFDKIHFYEVVEVPLEAVAQS